MSVSDRLPFFFSFSFSSRNLSTIMETFSNFSISSCSIAGHSILSFESALFRLSAIAVYFVSGPPKTAAQAVSNNPKNVFATTFAEVFKIPIQFIPLIKLLMSIPRLRQLNVAANSLIADSAPLNAWPSAFPAWLKSVLAKKVFAELASSEPILFQSTVTEKVSNDEVALFSPSDSIVPIACQSTL